MRAINATVMRQYNRKMILELIRRQPTTRAQLAEATHLTRASITQNVEELIAEGIVCEASVMQSPRLGRRSTQLVINPDAAVIFGVFLSRTQYEVGSINLGGEVLSRDAGSVVGRSAEEVLAEIVRKIRAQRETLEAQGCRVTSIGFSAPGPLNPHTGCFIKPPNFSAWHGRNVTEVVSDGTGLPVYIENVANAHALAEKYFGVAADVESFVVIRVDEGVGAGIYVRGGLYHGAHNFAAEFGHMSVDINGPECDCGNRGCLEQYISMPAILRDTPYCSWPELVRAAGEPEADAALSRMVHYLSFGIVNVINAFDVEIIVLAGDIAGGAGDLLDRINAEVRPRTIFPMPTPPVVAGSQLDPVLLSAMPAYRTVFGDHP